MVQFFLLYDLLTALQQTRQLSASYQKQSSNYEATNKEMKFDLLKQGEKENIHPNFSNQVGSGDSLNEKGPSDDTKNAQVCITEEEAIEGNLKKISLQPTDNTRYDPLIFLKTREDEIKCILQRELVKRKRMKIYLTVQVCFTIRRIA